MPDPQYKIGYQKGYDQGFEEGENSVERGLPGWFGTFADMMTLLFAFFVLLAAISTIDPVKLQEMADSTGKSLGSKIKKDNAVQMEGEYEKLNNLLDVKKALKKVVERMENKLQAKGQAIKPPIDITTSPKGVTVNIKGDYAFESGKAVMRPELKNLLIDEIIPTIKASPFMIEIAGHTDSDPLPSNLRKIYPSNWELSAARGASVVRELINQDIKAKRLIAAGYGDWSPRGLDSLRFADPNTITRKTVLKYNTNIQQKERNRRIQVTFLRPSHHSAKTYTN